MNNQAVRVLIFGGGAALPSSGSRPLIPLEGFDFDVRIGGDLDAAQRAVVKHGFHAVIIDIGSGPQGLKVFHRFRAFCRGIPLIVLAAPENESAALAALEEGASDYLIYGMEPRFWVRAVRNALEKVRLRESLEELVMTDELTGLANRRGLLFLARQQMDLAARSGQGLFVLFADMDGLRDINNRHGHPEGDRALREVAVVLKDTFRASDVIARVSGDEFAVVGSFNTNGSAEVLEARLESALYARNQANDLPFRLSLSVGLANFDPEKHPSLEELISAADRSMYEHKRSKRQSAARSSLVPVAPRVAPSPRPSSGRSPS
jgi:diguanylate cyclase (GGDEF)-like protein